MIALPLLATIGAWVVYSKILDVLMNRCSTANTIVSQIRKEGNMTLMKTLIGDLPAIKRPRSSLSDDDSLFSDFDSRLWGSSDDANVSRNTDVRMLGKKMILCVDENGGICLRTNQMLDDTSTLRSLITQSKLRRRQLQIISDPFEFYIWLQQLTDSRIIDLPKLSHQQQQPPNVSGTYKFCFRDYWNFEESRALTKRLGSIRLLKLRAQQRKPPEFVINEEDGSCTLTDFHVINGVVPMAITWEGKLDTNSGIISWSRTFIRKGWEWWTFTMDRPPMAEKYRQQPWKVSLPASCTNGDVLIFERHGVGRLVYARQD
jgi:hypothetical protein